MNTLKNTARIAGILYIITDLFMIFSGMIVDPKIYVPGDAVSTSRNILEYAGLFRLGFVSNIIGHIIFLALVLELYKLLKSVDLGQARLMVALVFASVPLVILNMLNQFAPVVLMSGSGYLSTFNPAQLQTLSMVFLELYENGVQIAEVFWGLWLIPLGILAYKSGFIPKVLAVSVLVGSLGHLLSFGSTFLFPEHNTTLTPISQMVMLAELPIFIWLLVKGVNVPQHAIQNA
jgi:hypothetical protein